jgi:tetratricopeptide (TPR) repeat protein
MFKTLKNITVICISIFLFFINVCPNFVYAQKSLQVRSIFNDKNINENFFEEEFYKQQEKLLSDKNITKESIKTFFHEIVLKNKKVFEWINIKGQRYIFYIDGLGGYVVEIEGFNTQKQLFFRLEPTYFKYGIRTSLEKKEILANPRLVLKRLKETHYFDFISENKCVIIISNGLLGGKVENPTILRNLDINIPSELISQFNIANTKYDQKEYQAALLLYLKIWQQIKNKSVVVYNNIGTAYEMLENYPLAIQNYQAALNINPAEPLAKIIKENLAGTYYNQGFKLYKEGKSENALQNYNTALQYCDYSAKIYNNRGLIYAQLKKYDEAIKDYEKALQLNPDLAHAYKNRANIYALQGKYNDAQRDYATALKDTTFVEAYWNRGDMYAEMGKHEAAIQDYTRAIELDQKCVPAYANRALAYLEQGELQKATEDFLKAKSLIPNSHKYKSVLDINIAYAHKKYEEAIKGYTNTISNISHMDNNSTLYYMRGKAFMKLGKNEEAYTDFQEALKTTPYSIRFKTALDESTLIIETQKAEALAKAGKVQDAQNMLIGSGKDFENKKDYRQAFELYDRALKFSDTNAEAWFLKGMIFYKHQNWERALDMFNKALQHNPSYIVVLLIRGKTFLVLEKFKNALEDFDKVLITENTNKEAQHGKGISLIGLGGYTEALPIFDQLLSIDFRTEDMLLGKARALDGLIRHEEAADFYRKAGMLQAAEECLIIREIQENILKSRAKSLKEKTDIFSQAMQKDKEDDLLIAGKILTLILQNKDIEAFQECKLANNERSSIQWICKALVYQKMKQHYNADKCFKNAIVALEFEIKNKPYDQKKSQIKNLVIKAIQDRDIEKYDVTFLLEQIILLYNPINMAPEIHLEQKNNGESILQWTEDNITREYVLKDGLKIRGKVISNRYRGCEIKIEENFEKFVDAKGRVMREESWSTNRLLGWVTSLIRPHLVFIEENEVENPHNSLIQKEYDTRGNILRNLRYEFLYDKYGRVIWETVYLLQNEQDTKGIFLKKIQRDYYSIGEMRLKKWRTFSSSPFPQNYPTYYICEQKMTEKFFTEDFRLLRKSKYDEFGNTKEYCEYEYNGPIHTRYTYHLDANQRLETKTVATFIEEKPVEIAFYDAQGNLVDKKIFYDEATHIQITTAFTSILGVDFIKFLLTKTIELLDSENIQKLCQKFNLPIIQQTRENLTKIVSDNRHPISALVLLELFQEISTEVFKITESKLKQKELDDEENEELKNIVKILAKYKNDWNIVFTFGKKGLLVQWDNAHPVKTYFPINLLRALKEFDEDNKQATELLIQELFEHENEEHRQGGIQKHYRAFSIGLYEFTKEDFSAIGFAPIELMKLIDSKMSAQLQASSDEEIIKSLNILLKDNQLLEKSQIKTATNPYGQIIVNEIKQCQILEQKTHLSRLLLKILFPYQAPNSSKTLSVLLRFLQDNAMDSDISSYSIIDEELFERTQYQLFLKDRLQPFTENKIDGIEVANPRLLRQNLSFEYNPMHTQEEADKDQNPPTEFIDLKNGTYNIFMGGINFSDTLVQFQLQTDEITLEEYLRLQQVKEKTNYMRLREETLNDQKKYFVDYYVPEKMYTTSDRSDIHILGVALNVKEEEQVSNKIKIFNINLEKRLFLKQLDTYNVQSCSIGIMFSNEEMPKTLIIGHFNNNTKLPYSLILGELLKTKRITQDKPLRFLGFLYPDVDEVEKFKNILSADVIVGDNSPKIPLPGESMLFIRSTEVYKMYPKDFRGHPVFSLLFLEGQPAIVAKYGHTLTTYSALAENNLAKPFPKFDSLTQNLITKIGSQRDMAIETLISRFKVMALEDKTINDTIADEQYTFSMTPLNAVFANLKKLSEITDIKTNTKLTHLELVKSKIEKCVSHLFLTSKSEVLVKSIEVLIYKVVSQKYVDTLTEYNIGSLASILYAV